MRRMTALSPAPSFHTPHAFLSRFSWLLFTAGGLQSAWDGGGGGNCETDLIDGGWMKAGWNAGSSFTEAFKK